MNLVGKKWGELTKEQKDNLLKSARGWDEHGNHPTVTKECIIDLIYPLSIAGKVVVTEETYIEISDDAVIYNSEEGI